MNLYVLRRADTADFYRVGVEGKMVAVAFSNRRDATKFLDEMKHGLAKHLTVVEFVEPATSVQNGSAHSLEMIPPSPEPGFETTSAPDGLDYF